MCADVIEFEVTCIGCLKNIDTPNDAEMELFRNGVRVHNNETCIEMAADRLNAAI